mmetsp:Transcript_52531/g.137763  ORF Transcript_52531/g.137763 Transcript_52531/m.137763 type:complete len:110 (+) Transcript_52531:2593-2922(+)
MAWNRMFSRPACGRERGSAQEVFMVCFSDVIRHGDGSLECTGFLEKPCGFEGLVVTLRFLADGPAQGGDGLFGVYCHEHCKLLKMTVCWSLFPVLSCAELCWHGIVLCL